MTNLIGISGKIGSGKDTVGAIIQYLASNSTKDIVTWINTEQNNRNSYSHWCIKKYADKLKEIVSLMLGIPRADFEKQEVKDRVLGEEWRRWYAAHYKASNNNNLTGRISPYFNSGEEVKEYIKNLPLFASDFEVGIEIGSNLPTVRQFLQELGTEAMRNVIHPNAWVNALFADYKDIRTDKTNGFIEREWKAELRNGKFYVPYHPIIPSEHHGKEVKTALFKWYEERKEIVFPNWIITDVRFPNEAKAIKDRNGIMIRVNRPIDLRFPNIWKLFISKNNVLHSIGNFFAWLLRENEEMKQLHSKLTHSSETALDDYQDFNYVIDNNGTIEELIEKVKEILVKEQVI